MTKRKKRMIYFTLALLCFFLYFIWQNTTFTITDYVYESEAIPVSMDGFRIVQISDLHNESYGSGNTRLLQSIHSAKPDAVLITGDLIDSSFTDIPVALDFVQKLSQIAPTYYCTGNHEYRLPPESLQQFLEQLAQAGAVVVMDAAVPLADASLIGLSDPNLKNGIPESLQSENFTILMAHEPQYFDQYTAADLIFSGHAHGGQIRLPFIGGLFAPGQGFFPRYTSGMYVQGDSTMLVSRGLGNSHRIPRLFNRPELVVVELHVPSAH